MAPEGANIFPDLLSLPLSPRHAPDTPGAVEGTVVKVADGGTITILDSTKQRHRIRIAGIDAPEKGQPFGNAARKRPGELVARKKVRVEFRKRDRYGGIAGKVWVRPPDPSSCDKTLDAGLAQIQTGMAS